MKKTYLLVYSYSFGSREQVKRYLDNMDDVETWRYDMPNCFYLVSETDADDLAQQLIDQSEGSGMFIVTEVTSNTDGLLTKEAWHLIENREKAGRVSGTIERVLP